MQVNDVPEKRRQATALPCRHRIRQQPPLYCSVWEELPKKSFRNSIFPLTFSNYPARMRIRYAICRYNLSVQFNCLFTELEGYDMAYLYVIKYQCQNYGQINFQLRWYCICKVPYKGIFRYGGICSVLPQDVSIGVCGKTPKVECHLFPNAARVCFLFTRSKAPERKG